MVRASNLGGVPVLNRPRLYPSFASAADKPMEGLSSQRPASQCFGPTWMRPERNVPVVMTTERAVYSLPSEHRMP